MFEYGQNRWSDNFDEYRPIGRDREVTARDVIDTLVRHLKINGFSIDEEPEETLTPEQEIDFTTAEWEVLAI